MKKKGKYYIVMTWSSSYETYAERWWEVHESVLPLEEAIGTYFKLAIKKHNEEMEEYRRNFRELLLKHGRKDLVSNSPETQTIFFTGSAFAERHNLSEECIDDLKELEKTYPMKNWSDYVEEVSGGLVKPLKANLKFRWKEPWE